MSVGNAKLAIKTKEEYLNEIEKMKKGQFKARELKKGILGGRLSNSDEKQQKLAQTRNSL